VNNLHSYIFLKSSKYALDTLTNWYEKKPNNKELLDLIKSVQYIVEHTNMVELERQLYRDGFNRLEKRCLQLQQEVNDLWGKEPKNEFNEKYKKWKI